MGLPSYEGIDIVDMSSSDSDIDNDRGDHNQGEVDLNATTLNPKDTILFEEVMGVIQEGGDISRLSCDHLRAYFRCHGLRIVGLKKFLVQRMQEHLSVREGQGINIHPRSSFSIDCTGDVVLGDIVLFQQNVYDKFDVVARRAVGVSLGLRWVAGRVVNESYGAHKQQHTFTPWSNEAERQAILEEKHARGREAREKRAATKAARSQRRSKGPVPRSRSDVVHLEKIFRELNNNRGGPGCSESSNHASNYRKVERKISNSQEPLICSTHGCENKGAWKCIAKSCCRHCRESGRTCPRHM